MELDHREVLMIQTLIKFRDVGYVIVILGLIVWGQGLSLRIAGTTLKIANARIEAQERADSLANELIIEQARNIGLTNQKATSYANQVRSVKDATSAGDAERNRIGNRGVRDILGGNTPAK